MLPKKSGHLVVISSVQAKLGIPYRSCYGASKAAVTQYYDSIRAELHDHGITVSCILPGYVQSNLSANALTA